MSLIGIYSDVHISRTSSIMPLYLHDGGQYTTRLQLCLDSIKFAYNVFTQQHVDLIINCGDTFNSHTTTSDEMSAFISALKFKHPDLPIERILVGNHDRFNNAFDSVKVTDLCEDKCRYIRDYDHIILDDYDIYMISYYGSDTFFEMVENMLRIFPRSCSHAILFMHGDINGSHLTGKKIIEGAISQAHLLEQFDYIINGHIHNHEVLYNKNDKMIVNIGSLTSHSFADNNDHFGACYILDTETGLLTRFTVPDQIVFRTYNVWNETDIECLKANLSEMLVGKPILKIKCPYSMKEDIKAILEEYPNIIKYKFIFTYESEMKDRTSDTGHRSNREKVDINTSFLQFLRTRDNLKGDFEDYAKIIGE